MCVFFLKFQINIEILGRVLGWYSKQAANKLVLNLDLGVLCIFTNELSLKSCIKLL